VRQLLIVAAIALAACQRAPQSALDRLHPCQIDEGPTEAYCGQYAVFEDRSAKTGREIKLNYATQVETSPPTIAVFGNAPDLVEEHYIRYLHNGFRGYWGFTGNPLRIVMRRKAG